MIIHCMFLLLLHYLVNEQYYLIYLMKLSSKSNLRVHLQLLINIENQKYVEEIQNNLTVLGPLYDYDPKTGKLTKVTY